MKHEFDAKTYLELLAYRIRILTHRIDCFTGLQLPTLEDVYMISRVSDGRYSFSNIRTGHSLTLSPHLLGRFRPDSYNTPYGLKYGIMTLLGGEWWQSGLHAWIMPVRQPHLV